MTKIAIMVAWVGVVACACSSSSGSCPAPKTAADAPPAAAAAPKGDALVGTWAEYWSVAGKAETSQYVFAADGTWSWRAVPDTEAIVARTGSWDVAEGALVLTTTSRDERPGCPGACESGAPKRVEVNPAVVERLPIGSCPPNDEAQKLDPSYTCMSFGDRAYWRRRP